MSGMMVPLLAAGGVYALWTVLSNRTDAYVDEQQAKDEDRHKPERTPDAFLKWISPADALTDKCNLEINYTTATAEKTADGRTRTDLCSRHGRAPCGMVGVQ